MIHIHDEVREGTPFPISFISWCGVADTGTWNQGEGKHATQLGTWRHQLVHSNLWQKLRWNKKWMYLLEHVIIMSPNWIKMYCWWFGVGQLTHGGSCFWGKESQIFCENKQEYDGLMCSHLLMSQSLILLRIMSLWYFYQGYWRWKIFFDVFVFFLLMYHL